jgi:hypothetical protein
MSELVGQLKKLQDCLGKTLGVVERHGGGSSASGSTAVFEIAQVNTRVHTLATGEQVTAFKNATMEIILRGGSEVPSNIRWSSSSIEVSIDKTIDGNGTVVIKSKPSNIVIISATDVGADETVNYALAIKFFVTSDGEKHKYADALKVHDNLIATPADHTLLYQQWGDLAEYPVWKTDDDYWTYEHDHDEVVIFNVREGTEDRVKRNLLHTNYYMYKI